MNESNIYVHNYCIYNSTRGTEVRHIISQLVYNFFRDPHYAVVFIVILYESEHTLRQKAKMLVTTVSMSYSEGFTGLQLMPKPVVLQ